jgi:hypothetical protein
MTQPYYAANGVFRSLCAFVPVKGYGDLQHCGRHLGEMLGAPERSQALRLQKREFAEARGKS